MPDAKKEMILGTKKCVIFSIFISCFKVEIVGYPTPGKCRHFPCKNEGFVLIEFFSVQPIEPGTIH